MNNYCYDLQAVFYDCRTGEVIQQARYRGHAQTFSYFLRDLVYYRLRFGEFIRKLRPRRVAVRTNINRIRSLHLTCVPRLSV